MNTNGDPITKFFGDGAESYPSAAFFSESGTGFYRDTSSDPGFVVSTHGAKRLKISDNAITSYVPISLSDIKVNTLEIAPSVNDTTFDLKLGQKTGFITEPYGSLTTDYYTSLQMNNWDILQYRGDTGSGKSRVTLQDTDGGDLILHGDNDTEMTGQNLLALDGGGSVVLLQPSGITCDSASGGSLTLGSGISTVSGTNSDFDCKSITSGSISSGTSSISAGSMTSGNYMFSGNTLSSMNYTSSPSQQIFFNVNGSTKLAITGTQVSVSESAIFLNGLNSNGTVDSGTNSLNCGSLTSGSIVSSGSISSGTNSMTCGDVTSSSQSFISLSNTGGINQTINNATNTVTNMWVVVTNRGTAFSYSSPTVTLNKTGIYHISCGVFWAPTSGVNARAIFINHSATTVHLGWSSTVGSSTSYVTSSTKKTIYATAGDTVNIQVYQDSGSSMTCSNFNTPFIPCWWDMVFQG